MENKKFLPEELEKIYSSLHENDEGYQNNNWLMEELSELRQYQFNSILEIGCGNGKFALEAAKHFNQVYAMDWAEAPAFRLENIPKNLHFMKANILFAELPQCNAIFSADLLEHFYPEDLTELLKKTDRSAYHQYHKIACYPDSRGLHLTLESPDSWLKRFKKIDGEYRIKNIKHRRNREDQKVVIICRGFDNIQPEQP
jgi:hypothetical protein